LLSFNSGLTAAFRGSTQEPVFLLELEYNAGGAGNILYLSDRDITCGSNFYNGIVLSFGEYQQSVNIMDFSASIAAMRVKLINTPGSLKGACFSDQFVSLNFINRAWRFYLWNDEVNSTYKAQIATGIISSDMEFDDRECILTLIDYSTKWQKELPRTFITAATYPNAPENNIGKPIPIWYGDFDVDSNAPTSTCEFDRHFVKGQVPAIITDKYNATDAALHCYPDTVAAKQLRDKNVFLGSQGKYCPCDDSEVVISDNPLIRFAGGTWRVYIPLLAHTDDGGFTNYERIFDGIFTTQAELNIAAEAVDSAKFNIGKLPNLGTILKIYALIHYGTGNTSEGLQISVGNLASYNNMTPGTDQRIDIGTTAFTADIRSRWALNESPLEINWINDILKTH